MLSSLRPKVIVALVLMLSILAAVSCGGDSAALPEPAATPNIDATVEAGVSLALAKASLISPTPPPPLPIAKIIELTITAVALPTNTPTPTPSPRAVYYSLADIESIGFVWDEKDSLGGITETTEIGSWIGTIPVDGKSESLSVSIFSETISTTDKGTISAFVAVSGDFYSVFITNVGLVCGKQEVCDYVATKISTELAHITRTTPLPTPTPNPAFRLPIDYVQFFADIGQNIVAAKAKYEGQKLIFVGKVSTIYEDSVTVYFTDGWNRQYISCEGLSASDVINLLLEYNITVQGISVFDSNTDYAWATLKPCSILAGGTGLKYSSPPEMTVSKDKIYFAKISTTEGDITVQLLVDEVPITVNSFVFLAREGFYTDVKFHRVIKDFMIQGGDPTGTGAGGPGYSFEDEPVTRDYVAGTVAMANAGPNTNGSQFFIMHGDAKLPKNYTIFGLVTEGIEVVDKIANIPVTLSKQGEQSVPEKEILIKSVVIEEN